MAEQKFEDALEKLEEIVTDLESGNLKLDDAIKKYEEGMKLAGLCGKKLVETKKKIEILVKDSSGKLSIKDFDEAAVKGDNADNASSTDNPKTLLRGKKRPRGEELLF
jgi:exodeoxyribonuclease VII small subunit